MGARTSIAVSALAGGVVDVDFGVAAGPLGTYREKVVAGAGRCREAVEIQRRRTVTKDDDCLRRRRRRFSGRNIVKDDLFAATRFGVNF